MKQARGGLIMRCLKKLAAGIAIAMLALAGGQAAQANDCGAGMVCASDPQSVADVLRAGSYEALLGSRESTGNPMIVSAANNYQFVILF